LLCDHGSHWDGCLILLLNRSGGLIDGGRYWGLSTTTGRRGLILLHIRLLAACCVKLESSDKCVGVRQCAVYETPALGLDNLRVVLVINRPKNFSQLLRLLRLRLFSDFRRWRLAVAWSLDKMALHDDLTGRVQIELRWLIRQLAGLAATE
jgi:hypothetical protein